MTDPIYIPPTHLPTTHIHHKPATRRNGSIDFRYSIGYQDNFRPLTIAPDNPPPLRQLFHWDDFPQDKPPPPGQLQSKTTASPPVRVGWSGSTGSSLGLELSGAGSGLLSQGRIVELSKGSCPGTVALRG